MLRYMTLSLFIGLFLSLFAFASGPSTIVLASFAPMFIYVGILLTPMPRSRDGLLM